MGVIVEAGSEAALHKNWKVSLSHAGLANLKSLTLTSNKLGLAPPPASLDLNRVLVLRFAFVYARYLIIYKC